MQEEQKTPFERVQETAEVSVKAFAAYLEAEKKNPDTQLYREIESRYRDSMLLLGLLRTHELLEESA